MVPQTKSLRASIFQPTTSLSGNELPTVFRGENFVLRGANENPYFETFPGNLDLNENYDLASHALTGTLAYSTGGTTVTGTGTAFKAELHLGQHILAGTQVLAVKEVVSDTNFTTDRPVATTESGLTGYKMLQMSEVNKQRCVMETGNVIEFGKGHFVGVGSGTVYINGQVLAGTSLVATNRAKAAIYRPATNDYAIVDLGYTTKPPLPTVTMITGGTKAMTDLNKYSFQISYWSGTPIGTDGYSDPCDPLKFDTLGAPIQINGTLNKFRMKFTTSLVGMPVNAKGFIIWANQGGKQTKSVTGATITTTSPNQTLYENGPRLLVAKVLTTSLTAGDLYEFEFLDSELGVEVTGGNDKPAGSEFVTKIDGRPMYISCLGKATVADGNGSNPGPSVVVSKFDNPDAAPLEWRATVGGTILGFIAAVGRWFLMTSNGLEFAVPTGLYGQQSQGGNDVALPVITRPYWKTGASNRYSLILIDDTLYGRSGGRFYKSVGYGDENVKKYDFGSVVEDIARDWYDGFVLGGNDPKHTQALFFHSAAYKNSSGYWVTEILPYSLYDAWLPKIILSSTTRDMIVTGVATVDEKLEFVCGGRVAGGTFQQKTYRWAAGDPTLTSMPAYLVWQPSDEGLENQSKQIGGFRLEGKLTNPVIQVHGARPGQHISTTNMETGTGADTNAFFSGDITFPSTTQVTRYLRDKSHSYKNLSVFTIRIASTWNGTGIKDRLEEFVFEIMQHGKVR